MRYLLGVNGVYAKGHSDGWHIDKNADEDYLDGVTPIGYQPFMRCSAQHGYPMSASDESYDMYKDRRFSKYKLWLTGELCSRVFEMTEEGAKVYPNGDVPKVQKFLSRVGQTTVFSEEVFLGMCERLKLDPVLARRELALRGYEVRRNPKIITDKKIREINRRYGIGQAERYVDVQPVAWPMLVVD